MVISHKMNESEMGYRGSKSVLALSASTVKEQRVDGSCFGISPKLRCTLMGFERNYPVKIPSKQLNNFYSTVNISNTVLKPWFVTGFTDAEGCFCTSMEQVDKYKTGWRVKSLFEIGLNKRDLDLLYQIKTFFGGIGTFSEDKKANVLKYQVVKIGDLKNTIIPHFQKYPLITQKAADFLLFEQVVELMEKDAHLNMNGLQKIVNIKASAPTGEFRYFIQSSS